MGPLEILFQDRHLVAVHKPSGLMVHRSPLEPHADQYALQLVRDQVGNRVYPIHRLDRPTSGVLIFAMNSEVARSMQRLNQDKAYLCVVRGYTEADGTIDHPLRDENGVSRMALTQYKTMAQKELPHQVGRYPSCRISLLCVRPQSGRQHQIRRHMKHIFHPIIGDTKYGDGRQNRFFREHYGLNRLLLMATELAFLHPVSKQQVTIRARVPEMVRGFFQAAGWLDQIPAEWI